MSPAATASTQTKPRQTVELDHLLTALPHPIFVLAQDNGIVYANAAAEAFLSTGIALLKRVRSMIWSPSDARFSPSSSRCAVPAPPSTSTPSR